MDAFDLATEQALCARIRAGSAKDREESFNAIFRGLRRSTFALCLHLTGRRSEAEDAFQDCFLQVHRGLPSFRGESRLATWVYRIAVRSALAVKARRNAASDPPDLATTDSDPERVAASREAIGRLAVALDRLPEEHRIVLSLFAIEVWITRRSRVSSGYRRVRCGHASITRGRSSGKRCPDRVAA